MDSAGALWAVAFVLPTVVITALCIGCRRRIPVHITETGYYDDKAPYNPPSSSFMIIKVPSVLPRTSTSQSCMAAQEMSLTFPRSPIPPDSRRSSVGRDMKVFQGGFEAAPLSPGIPISKNQDEEEDDEDYEYDEYPNYSNDSKSTRGYIEVLPDDSSTQPAPAQPVSPSTSINRESMSSAIYVNVEAPAESKEAEGDNNYVNVGDSNESLEYVNVDEAANPQSSAHQDSDDDSMPDYENLGNEHIG